MFSFYNNFTFSMFGLQRGHVWNMLTCHFTHMSFFNFLLDSVIIYLITQNLTQMYGGLFVAKTVMLSMMLGSLFLFAHHASAGGQPRPYCGNDAILRGLIFSIIFQNPSASLMLFPLPINIPAWAIACLLLGLDLMSFNTAGFGGVAAAYAMVHIIWKLLK